MPITARLQIEGLHYALENLLPNEIKINCLLVASDEELLIPLHCVQLLNEHIPNTSLKVIGNGVGHMFHIEKPDQLSSLALKFFRR